jgi:hypothetical protein
MLNKLNSRSSRLTLLHQHPTHRSVYCLLASLHQIRENVKWSEKTAVFMTRNALGTLKTRSPQVPGCDLRWANKLSPGRPCISIGKASLYFYFIDYERLKLCADGTERRQSGATASKRNKIRMLMIQGDSCTWVIWQLL